MKNRYYYNDLMAWWGKWMISTAGVWLIAYLILLWLIVTNTGTLIGAFIGSGLGNYWSQRKEYPKKWQYQVGSGAPTKQKPTKVLTKKEQDRLDLMKSPLE